MRVYRVLKRIGEQPTREKERDILTSGRRWREAAVGLPEARHERAFRPPLTPVVGPQRKQAPELAS